MELDWQTIVAAAIVVAAIVALAWRGWRVMVAGGRVGCGSCAAKEDFSGLKRQPVIQLQVPTDPVHRDGSKVEPGETPKSVRR